MKKREGSHRTRAVNNRSNFKRSTQDRPYTTFQTIAEICPAKSRQMGDVPSSTSAGEYASHEPLHNVYPGVIPNEGPSSFPQGPSPVNTSAFQQQYQQPYITVQNAFTNQFDMAHPQAPGQQGSFNMTAMGNALPQTVYRHVYNPGQHQQRHATGPMNPGVVQPLAQYNLANQPYYVHQHQQMSPYYNAHLAAHQQQAQQGHLRQNDYYTNSVMMNQPQGPMPPSYYYQQAHSYASPSHSIHGQMTPSQFIVPDAVPGDVQNRSTAPGKGQQGDSSGYSQPGSTSPLDLPSLSTISWR